MMSVQALLATAARAWHNFACAQQVFMANVQRFDFEAAETERLKMHTALDVNLDAHMAANTLIKQSEDNNGTS